MRTKRQSQSQAISEFRDSDAYTEEQLELLASLQDMSGEEFTVVTWRDGNAPLSLRLNLDAEVGDEKAVTEEFIRKFGRLWHVDPEDVGTRVVVAGGEKTDVGCLSTIASLHEKGERVFNAHLRFEFFAGKLRGVLGYLDGRASPAIEGTLPTANVASRRILELANAPSDTNLPKGMQAEAVIFDRYFIGERKRTPKQAWLFTETPGIGSEGQLITYDLGELPFRGCSLADELVTGLPNSCNYQQQSLWMPVVGLDPKLSTPTWVSLRSVGGVAIGDASDSPSSRVMQFMRRPELVAMFGDLAPEDHLRVISEVQNGSSAALTFGQWFAGKRVDNAYLSVEVQDGRVMELFAMLPFFPSYGDPLRHLENVTADAQADYLDWACRDNAECLDTLDPTPVKVKEVIYADEIFDQPVTNHSQLAYKIQYRGYTSWWSSLDGSKFRGEGDVRYAFAGTPNREFEPDPSYTPFVCRSDTTSTWTAFWSNGCPKLDPTDGVENRLNTLDIDLDGSPPHGAVHPDSPIARQWIADLDDRMESVFHWNGVFGDGGISGPESAAQFVDVLVNLNDPNEASNADIYGKAQQNGNLVQLSRPLLTFGVDLFARDILGHEYVHSITRRSYEPLHGLEPGALAEHYSDIVAKTIFPENGWLLGVDANVPRLQTPPKLAMRNLLDPLDATTVGGDYTIANMSNRDQCDSTTVSTGCEYVWIGVPNRAFALISDGVPSPVPGSSPLGRETTAKMYFETLRPPDPRATVVYKMQSPDRFAQQRAKLLSVCADMTRKGTAAQVRVLGSDQMGTPRTVPWAVCENIASAFEEVGVPLSVSSGYSNYNSPFTLDPGQDSRTMVENDGLRLMNGCAITGHSLSLEWNKGTGDGEVYSRVRTSADTPPLYICIGYDCLTGNDEFEASVVERCGSADVRTCPDVTNRKVVTKVATKWSLTFDTYTSESLSIPSAVRARGLASPDAREDKYCFEPLPPQGQDTTTVYYHSTPIVHTLAAWIAGKREDHYVLPNLATGIFVSGACRLLRIGAFEEHWRGNNLVRTPELGTMVPEGKHIKVDADSNWNFEHGFRVTPPDTNPLDYRATLHTWVAPGNQIFSRVVYELSAPAGVNCGLPGMVGPLDL